MKNSITPNKLKLGQLLLNQKTISIETTEKGKLLTLKVTTPFEADVHEIEIEEVLRKHWLNAPDEIESIKFCSLALENSSKGTEHTLLVWIQEHSLEISNKIDFKFPLAFKSIAQAEIYAEAPESPSDFYWANANHSELVHIEAGHLKGFWQFSPSQKFNKEMLEAWIGDSNTPLIIQSEEDSESASINVFNQIIQNPEYKPFNLLSEKESQSTFIFRESAKTLKLAILFILAFTLLLSSSLFYQNQQTQRLALLKEQNQLIAQTVQEIDSLSGSFSAQKSKTSSQINHYNKKQEWDVYIRRIESQVDSNTFIEYIRIGQGSKASFSVQEKNWDTAQNLIKKLKAEFGAENLEHNTLKQSSKGKIKFKVTLL